MFSWKDSEETPQKPFQTFVETQLTGEQAKKGCVGDAAVLIFICLLLTKIFI